MSDLRPLAVVSVAAIPVFFTGCASLQEAVGMKMDLEDEAVEEIEAGLAGGHERLCPREQMPLEVAVHLADGRTEWTEGAAEGKVRWNNFDVRARNASLVGAPIVEFPADPYATFEEPAVVEVEAVDHPGVEDRLEIPARYHCDFWADFSGADGRRGQPGQEGRPGDHGRDDSSGPGGHGQRGADGQHGRDGRDGEDGDDVEAFVDLVDTERGPLLEIEVRNLDTGEEELFLVDPDGGRFEIRTHGGDGGPGGPGGVGGRGGDGGAGRPPGNGGNGGAGGNGGNGGDGGDGGRVVVRMTPEAESFRDIIYVENDGGRGGEAGEGGAGGNGGDVYQGGNPGAGGPQGHPGAPGRDGEAGPPPDVEIVDRR